MTAEERRLWVKLAQAEKERDEARSELAAERALRVKWIGKAAPEDDGEPLHGNPVARFQAWLNRR